MSPRLSSTPWVGALLLLGACERSAPPDPRTEPTPKARATAAPEALVPPPAEQPAGLSWDDPAGWERVSSPSPMRKATYRIPSTRADIEPAELGVFYFGAQGGSIEANIERWLGQFQGATKDQLKRTHRSAGGLVQHIVEIERGTFSSGMPGGPTTPKANYALLGAIVETPAGPWFFKMTGPSKTVQGARKAFMELLDSAKL